MQRIYHVKPERIKVFYNAIPSPKPINQGKDDLYIGISEGWLYAWKRTRWILINAMKIVVSKHTEEHLILVGDGVCKDKLIKQVQELVLEKSIGFSGWLPHKKVIKLLQRGKLLVHPTRYDAMPNAIIEAISVGIPVVASNIGGIPEIIRDGVEGYLVTPEN